MTRIQTLALCALLGAPFAQAHREPSAESSPQPLWDGGNPPGDLPPKLDPEKSIDHVTRRKPVVLRDGILNEAPTLAISPKGAIYTAFVSFDEGDRHERIWFRQAATGDGELSQAEAVTDGWRAWHPRLAAGADGKAWLAWCGRPDKAERGDFTSMIWLRQVAPSLGAPIAVSSAAGVRACDPEFAIAANGEMHLTWEESPLAEPLRARVKYRKLSATGAPLAPVESVSNGPFDRRPFLLTKDDHVWVAWDSWVDPAPTGDDDPDFDLFMRERDAKGWHGIQKLDTSPGIQAAPALAAAPGGGVLVAYHSTEARGSLIKWWTMLRVRGTKIERLAHEDPFRTAHQLGEVQGAEFPAIAVSPEGRIFVFSRPSQGAYLHWLEKDHVHSVDLTLGIWGARGMKGQLRFAPDGKLFLVRRASKEPLLESFTITGPVEQPAFKLWRSKGKHAHRYKRPAGTADLLYGDVHMHSAISDGAGPPDEIYARAYIRGFDFAILTDHDTLLGSRMTPSEHTEIEWLTDAFNRLTRFTTLHAYEWTTRQIPMGGGHRNIYFRGYAPDVPYSRGTGHGETKKLFEALKGEKAFAVPHHIGWTGTDWENADPAIQRNVEIVSVHGVYDMPDGPVPARGALPGMLAVDGLKRGLQFGFFGGTDGHGLTFHHGIGRRRDPWGHGLTGLHQTDRSREAIWDALHARAGFTTSGPRMMASIEVAGVKMGAEGTAPLHPLVKFEVRGTAPLGEILLVRDGTTIKKFDSRKKQDVKAEWRDPDATEGAHSYFVRAVQQSKDGTPDLVWSSPVFVNLRP